MTLFQRTLACSVPANSHVLCMSLTPADLKINIIMETLSKVAPVLESSKSFYTIGYLRKSSEIFRDLWQSFKIFGNLRTPSVNLREFRFGGDE